VVETCSSNIFYAIKYCVSTEKLNYLIEKTQYGAEIPDFQWSKAKRVDFKAVASSPANKFKMFSISLRNSEFDGSRYELHKTFNKKHSKATHVTGRGGL
jgi:hypothetical protein